MKTRYLPVPCAALAAFTLITGAEAGELPATTPEAPPADEGWTTLFGDTAFARGYDELKAKKDEAGIPITVGAWHWFRVGTGGPEGDGYGIPGLRDTYYWYILFDPKLKIEQDFVKEIGFHADIRLRENGTFRPFINDQVWPWELYVYADTTAGKFKVGQVWKRFGLDWDGVFYGNVPYFDGFKLDPDYGVSWEKTFEVRPGFKVDSVAQFFLREDGINGTIEGSDAESTALIREQNTGVLRFVPTWTFADDSTLALGLSGSVGNLDNKDSGDETFTAWDVDLTYTRGNFKVFGEALQSYGTINPNRYVSGGPSDQITSFLVGVNYTTGPFTWRANYSAGYDENPDGKQSMFLPGVTVALTENADLYVEYVKWDVKPEGGPTSTYEDGMQFVINWRF